MMNPFKRLRPEPAPSPSSTSTLQRVLDAFRSRHGDGGGVVVVGIDELLRFVTVEQLIALVTTYVDTKFAFFSDQVYLRYVTDTGRQRRGGVLWKETLRIQFPLQLFFTPATAMTSAVPADPSGRCFLVNVSGDGECFFHSVFVALYRARIMNWWGDSASTYNRGAEVIKNVCAKFHRGGETTADGLFASVYAELDAVAKMDTDRMRFTQKEVTKSFLDFYRFLRLVTAHRMLRAAPLPRYAADVVETLDTRSPDVSAYCRTLVLLFPWLEIFIVDAAEQCAYFDRQDVHDAQGREHASACDDRRGGPPVKIFLYRSGAHFQAMVDTEPGVLEQVFPPSLFTGGVDVASSSSSRETADAGVYETLERRAGDGAAHAEVPVGARAHEHD